ncbi:MAG: DNA polymerase I [Bifidobacteriaceae bacterium]|jgi:DNA polymerase-1|nr:DNA polymerase I [Bifidobacteriaceae bacterium]
MTKPDGPDAAGGTASAGAKRPRLLVIDGHSMAYRAFHALPPDKLATTSGQPTNAVYGFTSMLIKLLTNEQPTHVGVAFDVSRTTFRTAIYPEYKATRSATPEEFISQVPLIKQVLAALRLPICELPDFEADDILATWATQGAGDGMEVLICSGDRDAFQLIGPDVTVLYPRVGVTDLARMTPDAVAERYGVGPQQYPDMAALVGETSDNLPGVPGVGPKTAAKWLNQYGSLQRLVHAAPSISGKVGERLREHLEQVLLNRQIGALVCDVDLPVRPVDLQIRGMDREAVHRVFDALQFTTLRERLLSSHILEANDAAAPFPLGGPDGAGPAEAAGPVKVEVIDVAGAGGLKRWLASRRTLALGLEVNGALDRGEGDAWSVAIADPQGEAVVIDTARTSQDAVLAEWLADPSAPKVTAEAKRHWHMLRGRGMELAGVVMDTTVAAYLCYPDQRTYDAEDLAARLLGEMPSAAGRDDSGQLMLAIGGGEEEAARAGVVARLRSPLREELAKRDSGDLLDRLEMPLVPILARMEAAGIAVDPDALAGLEASLDARVVEAAAQAKDAVGRPELNLASPKQLQEVLFGQLGFKPTKRTRRGFSTDAETLAELYALHEHPFLEQLLEHRDAIKLRQAVEGLAKAIGDDGRIHTTFQQTVAATGRLSSADPNLQNIPVRTEVGQQIRAAFTVGRGYETLITADYSQIEMRIMAHLSKDAALIEAFRSGEDLHSSVAGQVFGVPAGEVTAKQRSRIKAMSYGLAYGLSAYGLSKQLGITAGEAQDLMAEYFGRFGGIRDYLEGVVAKARRTGYTETIMGRRRYLPDLNSDRRQIREMAERMALNAPIQGSAADIIKVAMLGVDRALTSRQLGSRMLLQVHDELVVEVAPGEADEVTELLREEMGGAAKLSVPLDVSVGRGSTWQEAAH